MTGSPISPSVHIWDPCPRQNRPEYSAFLEKASAARLQRSAVRLDEREDVPHIEEAMDRLLRGDVKQGDRSFEEKIAVRVFLSYTNEVGLPVFLN